MKIKNVLAIAVLFASSHAFAADADASKTFPTPQSAAGAMAPHVGVVGGYADQNGNYKGSVAYGLDAGFQPFIPFGVGLQALFYNDSFDTAVPAGRAGVKRVELMSRFTYNLGGDNAFIKGLYLGGKFGAVINKPYFEPPSGNDVDGDSFTRFGLGPVIGGDYMLGTSKFSLGVEVSYLFVVGPESQMDTLQAVGAVKYWF